MRTPWRPAAAVLAALTATTVSVPILAEARPEGGLQHAELVGRAVLPALTFRPGTEPSGAQIGTAPINGVTPPFDDQPVQGFSGILREEGGTYLALSDNGYGRKDNSADFWLRVHRIRPDFAAGTITVVGGFDLSDPDGHVPFPLTRPDRRLTGADFDVESIQRLDDGTFWFGEEFGPFLLHTDDAGRVLGPPVPLPGVSSPQDPTARVVPANLGSSKGFEGMALGHDGHHLYPLLEGPLAGDPGQDLRMYQFDTRTRRYTEKQWRLRMEHPANAIGDLIAVDEHRFIVIERDGGQGAAARFKALFLLDKRDKDRDGYVDKTLLVNLMAVPDPGGIGGDGAFFRFPFVTIEGVVIVDDQTLAVVNDNNLPFSAGRTAGVPDDNEMILVRLDSPLGVARRFR